MRNSGVRWLLISLALLLNGLSLLRSHSGFSQSEFAAPEKPKFDLTTSLFREEFINFTSSVPSVHVASLAELPDGGLAASWYGGSREGARDVAVFFATQSQGQEGWSTPRPILTPQIAARDLNRAVRKVGNSLIVCDPSGKLWLLYVTINLGGWSGSSLNLTTSVDQGQTWSPSQRLTLSPFFNLSELVKNGPTRLNGGGWAVPIYHELVGKFPEILWLGGTARELDAVKSRVAGGRSGFQPALVALNPSNAITFLRDTTEKRRISVTRSDDAGLRWSVPETLDLPNPGSGLDAIRLADGRLLLAFNDSASERENLRLAISTDDGRTWKRAVTLAEEKGAEFSYPFLLQTHDGNIHVVYTWKRKAIKHVVFSVAWLNSRKELAPGT